MEPLKPKEESGFRKRAPSPWGIAETLSVMRREATRRFWGDLRGQKAN